MKILKIIGIIVLVIVIGIIGFVMTLKGESYLERSITIKAPAEKVFMVVNDFSYNEHWSPWFQMDPDTKYDFSEITAGVGATYSWDSEHQDVGTGKQEILESIENEYVNTQMWFGEMTGKYKAAFILKSMDGGTEVTWTYEGKADAAMEKFFIDYLVDAMLGPKYEEGLENLKTYIEALPDAEPEPEMIEPDSVQVEETGMD